MPKGSSTSMTVEFRDGGQLVKEDIMKTGRRMAKITRKIVILMIMQKTFGQTEALHLILE